MHFIYSIFIFFLILTSFPTKLDAQILDLCASDEISCDDGEVLTYKVYYKISFLWIPAGEVIFKTISNDTFYEFEATGRTYAAYDPFFKVRDYFYSKVDKKTLKPVEFVRKVSEGKYTQYIATVFNYEDSIAYTKKGKNESTAKSFQLSLKDNCVQDLLSLLYRLRKIDVSNVNKGDKIGIDLFIDDEIFPIDLHFGEVKKRKKIRNFGRHDVQKLTANLVVGDVFKEKDKMTLWISKDKNNIPLLIESPISVGSVKAVLKSQKGLAYHLGKN